MIYGTFDTAGNPTGFYLSELHGANIPLDAVEIDNDDYRAYTQEAGLWVRNGATGQRVAYAAPPPTEKEIIEQMTIAVQAHLDAHAQELGYDNIFTAVTYADESAAPKFQAEGLSLRAWRSNVWAACYQIMAEVKSGTRQQPTIVELISALPVFSMS